MSKALQLFSVALIAIVCSALLSAKNLKSFPDAAVDIPAGQEKGPQKAVFAGGCFWGVEAVFEHLKGVTSAVSGFSGGEARTAHYEIVSTGKTGHAESV
jgi:peptide-methionine (S)-S-oxide reductase